MQALGVQLEAACRRLGLPDGVPVVLAVSGGPDSVALLHLVAAMAPAHGWRVEVAHLDHALRDGSADDARFVTDLSRSLGLRARVRRVDVAALARERRQGIEEVGRQARYEFFDAVAEAAGNGALVLTAHTADDQAETVLLHLARGTGLAGLSAIAERRGRVVRPMLGMRRAALRSALDEAGLTYRSDPSNDDLRFARNRARAGLVPGLEQLHPGAVERLAALARRAGEEDRLLEMVASLELARRRGPDGWIAWRPPPTLALARRLLRLVAGQPAPSAERIEALAAALAEARGGRTIELGGARAAALRAQRVRIVQTGEAAETLRRTHPQEGHPGQ